MKKIVFISIDPAATSRRLTNQVNSALENKFSVEVITTIINGREAFKDNKDITVNYITLHYNSGVMKFLEYNLKLFLLLFSKKFDLLFCRGLWVMPGVIPHKIFRKFNLIYDAHEYFAGIPNFKTKPVKRAVWLSVESIAIRWQVDTLITVSEPIADKYRKKYPKIGQIHIIRNLPSKIDPEKLKKIPFSKKREKTVIYSGYLLPGRSLQNIIRSFSYINDQSIKLLIVGEGILKNELYSLTKDLKLENKIAFKAMVPPNEVISVLSIADIGLSLLKADCLNHEYALPNKFFEYIAAGVPVLASSTLTQKTYIEKYKVGSNTNADSPEIIAESISEMLSDETQYKTWQENCFAVAMELNWEKESLKLNKVYAQFN